MPGVGRAGAPYSSCLDPTKSVGIYMSRLQNSAAADVSRLQPSGSQSEFTFAATVLQAAHVHPWFTTASSDSTCGI